MKYADKRGYAWCIMANEEEIFSEIIIIKEMFSGKEYKISQNNLIDFFNNKLIIKF
jgi:histidyl-tRNA synthetase